MQAQTGAALSDMPIIPAMTTDAERECYYRLAKDLAHYGAVVELGAWLGASSAYLAAAMRDSDTGKKVHVYDRFLSKPGHIDKVKAFFAARGIENAVAGPCLNQFNRNLGPLLEYVEPHQGEISNIDWQGGPISLLVTDAPKRVPEISTVLTRLRKYLVPGTHMAWQDFGHFPSYEIPACLYRLREHLEFVEAVVPGTTLVFRVKSQWSAEEVSREALALDKWTPEEITAAWTYWADFVPAEKRALFECGATMFLCDIGWADAAVPALSVVLDRQASAVLPKWQYLREKRPDFVKRYAPLFGLIPA